MRIAHILWSMGTGGTENMVVDIASVQAENHQVSIFVINDWVEAYMLAKLNPKCKVEQLKRKPGSKNPFPLLLLNWKLWRFRPDVIHLHSSRSINCIWACSNVPKVRTIHGLGNNPKDYVHCKRLIAISQTVSDFTRNQGFDSVVINNGIRVNAIVNSTIKKKPSKQLEFVQVSRLHMATKGQDVLIRAIAKLKEDGYCNFRLHFVGDGKDRSELKKLCEVLYVDDLVVFEGNWEQERIYSSLSCYDLFIQPSRNEGFGLTIAEAMAAKVPVLVSDIPGPMEVISGGRFGLFFENENFVDCAEKIKKFIENGRNESQVEAAFQYAREHYDVSVTAKKYLSVYKSIVF